MTTLIPNYMDIDYNTLRERLQTLMQNSDTFKDYNYSGANITMLIELFSYLSELTTYYTNKIAKNVYPETADLYQTLHSLVNLQGYFPKGTISSQTTLTVTLDLTGSGAGAPSNGDEIFIPSLYQIETGLETEAGDSIIYSTTKDYTFTIPTSGNTYSFDINLKQGYYQSNTYTGEDIINNKIVLPDNNVDFDTIPYDELESSTKLFVNGEPWTRVENFISDITQLENDDNVYMLEFDKYERYNILFSSVRSVPEENDIINVLTLVSLGNDGSVGANTITSFTQTNDVPVLINNEFETQTASFIYNNTQTETVISDFISITNSSASINHANIENLDTIREGGKSNIFAQYRNVTSGDYIDHLEEYPSITVANVWGEKEQNPGNTTEYNKMYISLIPSTWSTSTITTSADTWITTSTSADINVPVSYNETFKSNILEYLETRKHLSVWEEFVVPVLVYFGFNIEVKTKRLYNYNNVITTIQNKLEYYFQASNRNFNETIDFREIHNFILDVTEQSDTDSFDLVKGIDNLIIRDIVTYTPNLSGGDPSYIFEYNSDNNAPMFSTTALNTDYENVLRPITLGLSQFPVLSSDMCTYINGN